VIAGRGPGLEVDLCLNAVPPGVVQHVAHMQKIGRKEILKRISIAAAAARDGPANRDAIGVAIPRGVIESDGCSRFPALFVPGIPEPCARRPGIDPKIVPVVVPDAVGLVSELVGDKTGRGGSRPE
jgi:hypothetical protein